jgi:uncharacterized SAM-binding protein YcdF (DUF218 family)
MAGVKIGPINGPAFGGHLSGIPLHQMKRDLGKLWSFLAPRNTILRQEMQKLPNVSGIEVSIPHLKSADTLLLLGSNDPETITTTQRLFNINPRLMIVTCGKGGHRTVPFPPYNEAEAVVSANALLRSGIPKNKIIIEPESANSGANIINSREILFNRGIDARRVIIVQSPAAQLRGTLCFEKKWHEKFNWEYYISFAPIPAPITGLQKDKLEFNLLYALRELGRLICYSYDPACDFQTQRPIPKEILKIASKYQKATAQVEIPLTNAGLYDIKTIKHYNEHFGNIFLKLDEDFIC